MLSSRIPLPAGASIGARGAITTIVTGDDDLGPDVILGRNTPANADYSPGDTVVVRNTGTIEAEVGSVASVTAGNGFRLAAGASLPAVTLVEGETLAAAVVGTTAGAIDVLITNAAA